MVISTSSQQHYRWHGVQRAQGEIYVTSKSGRLPQAAQGQARVNIVSASICGADVRIAKGDKIAHTHGDAAVTMGHEGCGRVDFISEESVTSLRPGDFVVVLPHIHVPSERAGGCTHTTTTIEVACTSRHHTDHAGWDFHGVFSDIGVFPLANLVAVPPEHLARAEQQAPDLGRALFTITEPLLCCLSAYELMGREVRALCKRDLAPGRALVVGCGPIGTMHGIILADRGYQVSFYDPIPQRARLAQYCLGGGQLLLDADRLQAEFNVVIVTANVLSAIRIGERAVKDDGVLYLFAGMNACDRDAAHPAGLFSYELVHRLAQGVLTWTGEKRVLYVGHSGYYAQLAPSAIAIVSANAARLARLITGVIPGWDSPTILARVPGGDDWQKGDGSAAITSVLSGMADVRQHGKIIVLPGQTV